MTLFICHGNVARSQFAEALLRETGVTDVESAGTHISEARVGNRIGDDGPSASRIAGYFRHITGIDISRKTRSPVTPGLAEKADTIVVLTDPHDLPDYFDQYSGKMVFWDIPDPHDMDIEGCREVVGKIEKHVRELI